jgi:hypothetical protein
LKNTLRPNVKKGITKEQHITQPQAIGRNWVGLLKNTLRPNVRKESQKSNTIPAFIVGRTVENTFS